MEFKNKIKRIVTIAYQLGVAKGRKQNWEMELKALIMFGKSVKILTLATDRLSMHFVISKVTTKEQKQSIISKQNRMRKKYLINPKEGKKEEKKMKHVNTKKDGRHTSKYINSYNKYKWTKCTMKTFRSHH